MRSKIDYGIDLGTTNSAIARMENGVPTIIKTDVQKDTMPSCVHINRAKNIDVGDRAFGILVKDNARAVKTFKLEKINTFTEFKRTMGTTETKESESMQRSFSSEELSAEVLKKLKSFVLDENIYSIVITVPAKFLNPQNEATIKAAKLAGFEYVQLLQEPVAAATAFGLSAKDKNGYWCVFDFGGGTFDVALVKSEEGILTVRDTDGDNWLGGKDLDEAIVDQIIIPHIQKEYLIDSVIKDNTKKEILRQALKSFAEVAKNQLSFKEKENIYFDDDDIEFEDDNGNQIEVNFDIEQQQLEKTLAPIFQKAIDITKQLLERNNLKGDDLGELILVGGPTFSPILRKMLKQQITENINTSIDPMTAVATGAALFASTISVSEEVQEISRDKTKLQLELKHEATTVEVDGLLNIRVLKEKTEGIYPEEVYVDIERSDGGWSSGKQKIGEKAHLINVNLLEDRSNSFNISVYDEIGNKIECQPNQFNILQGISGLDGMQVLPYHIGIGKWFPTEEKNLFKAVDNLEKNKQIKNGLTGVLNDNKTQTQIRPGVASDRIRIPIYQGDYGADGTNPLLNELIREVIITGEDLPALLPKGSDVEITIKINSSQVMEFSAYIPLLDYTERLTIDIKQKEPPTYEFLFEEIAKAQKAAWDVNSQEIADTLGDLQKQLNNEQGSADGRFKILDNLRKELLKLDALEKQEEWPKVESSLKDSFYQLEDLISKFEQDGDIENYNIPKLKAHIAEYKNKIEYIIKNKNIKEAKELTEEIIVLIIEITNALTDGDMDRRRLEYHDREFHNLEWKDSNKARVLVNQGMGLIAEGKTSQLRPLLHQIWDLRIDLTDNDGETLE